VVQPTANDQGQPHVRHGTHRRVIGQSLAGGEAVGIISNDLVSLILIDMHKESVHIHWRRQPKKRQTSREGGTQSHGTL
jgi:hypothetical protein